MSACSSIYVLVVLVRTHLAFDRILGEILQIFSLTLSEKTPVFTVLTAATDQSQWRWNSYGMFYY